MYFNIFFSITIWYRRILYIIHAVFLYKEIFLLMIILYYLYIYTDCFIKICLQQLSNIICSQLIDYCF